MNMCVCVELRVNLYTQMSESFFKIKTAYQYCVYKTHSLTYMLVKKNIYEVSEKIIIKIYL